MKHRENQEKLEVCVQLQGYHPTGITEAWWDSLHSWSPVVDGCRLFRNDRLGGKEGVLSFI